MEIQVWHIDHLVFYARNPRKNDAAVDRMCGSVKGFGFKVAVLALSDGTVMDGHLRINAARRLGSWPGGDTTCIPVILCDESTDAQVKAVRPDGEPVGDMGRLGRGVTRSGAAGAERVRRRSQSDWLRGRGARDCWPTKIQPLG